MNITGKIIELGNVETRNNFRFRNLILETFEKYPQFVSLQFQQKNCELLDMNKVGDKVDVNINLRGRKWTDPNGQVKYFNSIVGWRIREYAEEVSAMEHSPDREDLPF
jgi:single-strand DNA-binding protein|tara:strand:- start:930 stop:1253 length:324 start_codon:yes stop_codon:yes gene_type:complete